MRRFLIIVLGICTFSCTVKKEGPEDTTSAVPSSDTTQRMAIENLLLQYYTDMTNRDWPRYRDHFWAHGTITTTWQQPGDSTATVDVTTIDDFIKETPNGPDSKPIFEERMNSSEVKIKGNIAEAWVKYEAKFGTKDSLMQWTGTDVFTLLRHNGTWKIVSLVFESDQ